MSTNPFDIVPDRGLLSARVAASEGRILVTTGRRVLIVAEQNDDPGLTSMRGALDEVQDVFERARGRSLSENLAQTDKISDAAAALLVRFTDHNAWEDYPVRRATRDGDPRAYLMHLALSPEMLVKVLMTHRLGSLPLLERILTDPRLSARAMAEEIYRGGPRSHLVISHTCFGGAPLDQGERRFYHTGREGAGRHSVYDFATGRSVVQLDADTAFADQLVTALEARSDLAECFVSWAERHERQRQLAYASMLDRPPEHGRTPESLALDPLGEERERLLVIAVGQEAYDAYQAGMEARTQAWAAGVSA